MYSCGIDPGVPGSFDLMKENVCPLRNVCSFTRYFHEGGGEGLGCTVRCGEGCEVDHGGNNTEWDLVVVWMFMERLQQTGYGSLGQAQVHEYATAQPPRIVSISTTCESGLRTWKLYV